MIVRLAALSCLAFLLSGIRVDAGEDFSLDDAFDPVTPDKALMPTPKPDGGAIKPATTAPKPPPKPHDDDGFDLGDALGGDTGVKPTNKPQPGGGGGGGGGGSFGDDDLADAAGGVPHDDPSGHDGKSSGGNEGQGEGQEKQSVIAGVLSALGVAAVGAVTSFVAYQKKKLCFKGQAEDPENVNMDNQKDQNDPQAQNTLLEK
ncbi:CD99 antigen isoform X2 [Hyperolius riggenbachi]|uniref:CD99 antigen isoform X2 n=1 Tax=Hyperolius riggenbachi TaxID=752182 RepID=UPI0035A39B44